MPRKAGAKERYERGREPSRTVVGGMAEAQVSWSVGKLGMKPIRLATLAKE